MTEMIFDTCQRLGGHVWCVEPYRRKVANPTISQSFKNSNLLLDIRIHQIKVTSFIRPFVEK
jgi:hypothetical protein